MSDIDSSRQENEQQNVVDPVTSENLVGVTSYPSGQPIECCPPDMSASPCTTADIIRAYLYYRLKKNRQDSLNTACHLLLTVPSMQGYGQFLDTDIGRCFTVYDNVVSGNTATDRWCTELHSHVNCLSASGEKTNSELAEHLVGKIMGFTFGKKEIKDWNYIVAPILVLAEICLKIQRSFTNQALIPQLVEELIRVYKEKYFDYWINQRGGWRMFSNQVSWKMEETGDGTNTSRLLQTYVFPWNE